MKCPICGAPSSLTWAAMTSWDTDGWVCVKSHAFAHCASSAPTPTPERTTAARTATATEEDQ